jgi:hypothetical protein
MFEPRASTAMILPLTFCLAWSGCASDPTPRTSVESSQSQTLEDVIPLTSANLRGHKMLYDEGWHVITSSKKSLEYAKEKSIRSSGAAIQEASRRMAAHSSEYTSTLGADLQRSLKTGKSLVQSGTERSGDILEGTRSLTKAEWAYATQHFGEAWEGFIYGNLSLGKRTQQDREALLALPGHEFDSLKQDFSNIWDITKTLHENFSGRIQVSWDAAFQQAGQDFRTEYERSGEQPNSLMALGPILQGYLKALYHGGLAPAAKTIVRTSAKGAGAATGTVFLPVATTSIVAGRTIQAAGMTLFYTGKTGIKLISPTVESGLLSSLAILSLGSVPVTAVSGTMFGAVNQVAFTAGGPTVGVGETAALATFDTGKYVGFVTYDALSGATKVVINQAAAGVVLGYNALSALPAHLFMGAEDAAILLAWEGPKLLIVKVTGRAKGKQGGAESSAGDLPVGTVINLKQLQSTEGMKVEVLSEDPNTIRDVLQQLPCDVRDTDGPCTAK